MATGDKNDFASRLLAVLPGRWFGSAPPVLTGLLTGLGAGFAAVWNSIQYTILQTRIATATGLWLDGISQDFFQGGLPRLINEQDAAFSTRIRANIFIPKNTRAAIIKALTALGSPSVQVFEVANTGDTGGWDTGYFAYDIEGGYGETDAPFNFFVTAQRVPGGGIASVDGWDGAYGGYDAGSIEWTDPTMAVGQVTDAQMYSTILSVKPAATIAWVRLH